MSIHDDYWQEALSSALEEHGAIDALTPDQRAAVAADLAISAEQESMSTGEFAIPHPATAELRAAKAQAAKEIASSDARAELYRQAYAACLGVSPDRVYIHNGIVHYDLRA